MIKKTTTVGALTICAALFLSACSGGTGSAVKTEGPDNFAINGTLTTSMVSDPGSLSPLMTVSTDARSVLNFLYDRLTYQDPASGQFKPWLAESWTEAPSKVTFTLKSGITCSDGTPLTAQTVADNFNFVATKDNNSPLRDVYVPGDLTATADNSSGVVTLATPAPSPFLLANASTLNIACESAVKEPTSVTDKSAGTGLFVLKEATANDHYTLERRSGYSWGPDATVTSETPGVPATVVFKIVPSESAAANLLLSGGLNIAAINGPDEARVKAAGLSAFTTHSIRGEMFYNQMTGKPTEDPAVRIALTEGLDLDNVAKVMTAGKGTRADQLSTADPVACTMTTTNALPAFDAAAAAEKLDAAGWKTGADGKRSKAGRELKLTLLYEILNDTTTAAAEFAQQQWAKIGVTITLAGGDSNMVVAKILGGADNGSWDIVWVPVGISTPNTIVPFVSGAAPAAGTNFASIHNTRYEAEVKNASTLVGDQACKAWGTAETALFSSADVVPFATTTLSTYLAKASLSLKDSFIGPSVRLLK
ncbi:ABC transporter substrate-binding protein [Arthrobacter sp. 4R501]|uniref:ABC transporter substrate-binding protein n=1 Tax=Arthrobacter sp. 4R501 TaxID=2058886 RepID=UPI000CE40DA8|nr:ABC transporter substrate-binding protein [Arthrobacter sp. 4R501]